MAKLLSLMFLILSLSACTVKENRLFCPILYELKYVKNLQPQSARVILMNERAYLSLDTLYFNRDSVYTKSLERASFSVLAVSPANIALKQDLSYECLDNEYYPPLYFFYREYAAAADKVSDVLKSRKEYCALTISFKGFNYDSEQVKLLAVYSRSAGIDKRGNVIRKDWHKEIPYGGALYKLNIPRQFDNSLILELAFNTGGVKRFFLGEFLEKKNYDWTKENLDDFNIVIDLSLLSIDLQILPWDRELYMNITI